MHDGWQIRSTYEEQFGDESDFENESLDGGRNVSEILVKKIRMKKIFSDSDSSFSDGVWRVSK